MVYFDFFCTSMFVYRRVIYINGRSVYLFEVCEIWVSNGYISSELGGYPLVSPNSLWQPLEISPEKRSISLYTGGYPGNEYV